MYLLFYFKLLISIHLSYFIVYYAKTMPNALSAKVADVSYPIQQIMVSFFQFHLKIETGIYIFEIVYYHFPFITMPAHILI